MTTALVVKADAMASSQKNLGDMISSWLSFLRVSEKTAQTYCTSIRQWKKYCVNRGILNPARGDVIAWLNSLIAAKKSASTINLYLTSVKMFYKWTALEGLYPDIAEHVKSGVNPSHKHKKSALSATQGGALIQSIKGDSVVAKRNRAIVALMLTAGLRTIEISRANVSSIEEIDGRYYLHVLGKGRSDDSEMVLLASQVYTLIQVYLDARGSVDDNEPLFTATRRNKGGRLSQQTISKMTKKYLRGIGLEGKRYSAHSLRHSAACQMVLAGVELRHVQACLRHKSIVTTLLYLDHRLNA